MYIYSIAVVGGGASGLMAAIAAARCFEDNYISSKKIIILDRMSKVGKKIISTGNGRCNITNTNLNVENYHGRNPEFVRYFINKFGYRETFVFFKSIGVLCKAEEQGKVYPYSDQASSVLDVLRMEISRLGNKTVTINLDKDVQICTAV